MRKSCWKSIDSADTSSDELIKSKGLKEYQIQSSSMIDTHGNLDDSNVTECYSAEANKTEGHFVTAVDETDEFYSPQEEERERNVFAVLDHKS